MTEHDDTQLFQDIVTKALQLRKGEYRDELSIGEVEGWDSLGHLTMISELERAFNVSFSIDVIPELRSLPAIRAAIKSSRGRGQ